MAALELITGFVTAPSTTLTAVTLASGNSLTVRNAPENSDIRLLQAWSDHQSADAMRIRSPRMHDNVQGIRLEAKASIVSPLIPRGIPQRLTPQDTLVAEVSGSGTGGDIETLCFLIYYANLPGIEANLISPDDLRNRAVNILAVENTLALGTSGGYSGDEALNAEFDLFKGNTDYAIIGYQVSAECACIRYRGSDFGNLGVGGPGNEADPELTANWFLTMSEQNNLPLIPVFNSANVDNVLIDGAQDENGTDVLVNTILAELS